VGKQAHSVNKAERGSSARNSPASRHVILMRWATIFVKLMEFDCCRILRGALVVAERALAGLAHGLFPVRYVYVTREHWEDDSRLKIADSSASKVGSMGSMCQDQIERIVINQAFPG